jgi:hypothetical protein
MTLTQHPETSLYAKPMKTGPKASFCLNNRQISLFWGVFVL